MGSSTPDRSGPSSESPALEKKSSGCTIPDALSVEEHGRTYNAYREGKYLLPNDGDEQDRLDIQHRMWWLILGGNLTIAPISEPKNVLDIGTGTGIWAIQFARQHPTSTVIGQDISLIQPTDNLPPNCTFVREDTEEPWVFDMKFEYIHWRTMLTCFKDHKAMIAKVYDNLVPGGWAEFQEWTFEVVPESPESAPFVTTSALAKWCTLSVAGGRAFGRDFRAPLQYAAYMRDEGFVDIQTKQILVPVSVWPADPVDKRLGGWFSLDALKGVRGTGKLLEAAGVKKEDVEGFMDEACESLTDVRMRAYSPHYVFYGRRPE